MKKFRLKMVVDTREQLVHIEDTFKRNGLEVERRKLDFGDYSCVIVLEDGFEIDITDKISIERKHSLDEFINNTIHERERFVRELERMKEADGNMLILLEDANFYSNILQGKYRSKATPNSVIATIKSLEARYKVVVVGVDKESSANYMYKHLYYYAREIVKNMEVNYESVRSNMCKKCKM